MHYLEHDIDLFGFFGGEGGAVEIWPGCLIRIFHDQVEFSISSGLNSTSVVSIFHVKPPTVSNSLANVCTSMEYIREGLKLLSNKSVQFPSLDDFALHMLYNMLQHVTCHLSGNVCT